MDPNISPGGQWRFDPQQNDWVPNTQAQEPISVTTPGQPTASTGGGGLIDALAGNQGENITRAGEFGGSFAGPLIAPLIGGGSELLRALLYGMAPGGVGNEIANVGKSAASAEVGSLGGKLLGMLFHPIAALGGKLAGDMASSSATVPFTGLSDAISSAVGKKSCTNAWRRRCSQRNIKPDSG